LLCLHIVLFLVYPHFVTPLPFPYTTLFRSVPELLTYAEQFGGSRVRGYVLVDGFAWDKQDPQFITTMVGMYKQVQTNHGGDELGDRKSTRLNSSHQIISYAVFCLKKKNYR